MTTFLSLLKPHNVLKDYLFKKNSQRFLTKTYYDSQSGMHVPIHDETKISVYMNWSHKFIHMYKNQDDAFEVKEELETLMSSSISGVFIDSTPEFPRDNRNMATLCDICPSNFSIFAWNSLQNVLCDYKSPGARETLLRHAAKNLETTLAITSDDNSEPWEIANEVATLIDTTSGTAGNFVWINLNKGSNANADDVLRLCEELSYLDVQGPTMKSRLIVDTIGGDNNFVEECMMIGINKFVVDSVDQVESCVKIVAEEEDKELVAVR